MQTLQGQVQRLGQSSVIHTQDLKTYSLIEIGQQVVPNLSTSIRLANFLSDCVGHEATLYLSGQTIVACSVHDRTYVDARYKTKAGVLLSLALGAVAGFVAMMAAGLMLMPFKDPGGLALLPMALFGVGASMGYLWSVKRLAVPAPLKQLRDNGATAV